MPALPRNMPPLRLLWKQAVAGACDAGIAVSAGRVLVPDHDEKQDAYHCLDAQQGTDLWTRTFPNDREMDYGAGPRATPLVYQGKVYVLSAFGELYCFDLGSGKTVWQKDFSKDFGAQVPKWGFCGSPLVARGKLIVNPGGKAAVAALEPETGKVLWQGAGGRANYSSFIAGVFGGVEQVVGHDDASLGGWDLATGKRLWSVAMEQGDPYFIVPTPVAVGGKLLVADNKNDTQLFAFGKDGVIIESPVAKSEDLAPEVMTPVATGDLVLGQSKKLVCLDAAHELKTLWTEPAKVFRSACHLIVADGVALGLDSRGEAALFSFDHNGMKVLGQAKLCQRTQMHPTVALGRLYLRDGEFLYCYALQVP